MGSTAREQWNAIKKSASALPQAVLSPRRSALQATVDSHNAAMREWIEARCEWFSIGTGHDKLVTATHLPTDDPDDVGELTGYYDTYTEALIATVLSLAEIGE